MRIMWNAVFPIRATSWMQISNLQHSCVHTPARYAHLGRRLLSNILQVWVLRWTLNSVQRNKVFGVSTGGCFPSVCQWLQVIISPLQPASLYWAHWMRSSASCCFCSLVLEQKSVVMLHKIRLIMNFSLVTIGLFWEFCHCGEESRTDGSQGNPAYDFWKSCVYDSSVFTPLCRRWP